MADNSSAGQKVWTAMAQIIEPQNGIRSSLNGGDRKQQDALKNREAPPAPPATKQRCGLPEPLGQGVIHAERTPREADAGGDTQRRLVGPSHRNGCTTSTATQRSIPHTSTRNELAADRFNGPGTLMRQIYWIVQLPGRMGATSVQAK